MVFLYEQSLFYVFDVRMTSILCLFVWAWVSLHFFL